MAQHLSLGGAFGLLHYLDYRATHDSLADLVASKMVALVEPKGLCSETRPVSAAHSTRFLKSESIPRSGSSARADTAAC